MLTFCGYDLELVIDAVLDRQGGPRLCSATDTDGGYWLILEVDRDAKHLAWLCAPISLPALHAVRSGRATPRDAFCHSATGTVELIRIEEGRAMPDRCFRCQDVPEQLLPPSDWQLEALSDLGTVLPAERRACPRHPAVLPW